MDDDWTPTTGKHAVDTTNGRIGEVRRLFERAAYLVPPDGDREWAAPPGGLRRPTDTELSRALTWSLPVGQRS